MDASVNTGGVRYKTGLVAEAKPGFAKVRFADIDELVTQWLPVLHPKTQNDKVVWTLDAGEQVACIMDADMEDGCIVGAIYSDADAPPTANKDLWAAQFKDGGYIRYDRASGALDVQVVGAASITVGGDATITVQGNVLLKAAKATIDAVCEFLKQCTFQAVALFPGGMGGGAGAGTTIPGTIKAEKVQTDKGTDLDGHHHTEQGDNAPTSAAQM